jgi:hypothetical protein
MSDLAICHESRFVSNIRLRIGPTAFTSRPLPNFSATLFNQRYITEFAPLGSFRFLSRHTAFHQIGDLLFEVFADGCREFVVATIAYERFL